MRCQVAVLFVFILCAQSNATAQSGERASGENAAQLREPDSKRGLKRLVDDLLKSTEAGNPDKILTRTRALEIPKYREWFKANFGDEAGRKLAEQYESWLPELDSGLRTIFAPVVGSRKRTIEVFTCSGRADLFSTIQRVAVTTLMQRVPKLYCVFVYLGAQPYRTVVDVGHFVHLEGAFRLLGRMYVVSVGNGEGIWFAAPNADVQHERLLGRTDIQWPLRSSRGLVPQTIRIQATIRRDGTLSDLEPIDVQSGFGPFHRAVMESIKRWHFFPLTINGKALDLRVVIEIRHTYQL